MSDLSASPNSTPDIRDEDEQPTGSLWQAVKKAATRLSDWFTIQSAAVKVTVMVMAMTELMRKMLVL